MKTKSSGAWKKVSLLALFLTVFMQWLINAANVPHSKMIFFSFLLFFLLIIEQQKSNLDQCVTMATRSAEQPQCHLFFSFFFFAQQHPPALPMGPAAAPRHCGTRSCSCCVLGATCLCWRRREASAESLVFCFFCWHQDNIITNARIIIYWQHEEDVGATDSTWNYLWFLEKKHGEKTHYLLFSETVSTQAIVSTS